MAQLTVSKANREETSFAPCGLPFEPKNGAFLMLRFGKKVTVTG